MKKEIYGVAGVRHAHQPNYHQWGRAGSLESESLSLGKVAGLIQLTKELVDLSDYQLTHAARVSYFVGADGDVPAIWLRFELLDRVQARFGQHISFVFAQQDNRLLGFARMLPELDNETYVGHQQALETALVFLQQLAPDLISQEGQSKELLELPLGSRIEFKPSLKIANLELNWIDVHVEKIKAGSGEKELCGMKVKFFIPEKNLWAWVIVDKNNQVMMFERDVSWDFDNMLRNTQMWLHDGWLRDSGYMAKHQVLADSQPSLQ